MNLHMGRGNIFMIRNRIELNGADPVRSNDEDDSMTTKIIYCLLCLSPVLVPLIGIFLIIILCMLLG